MLRIIQSKSAEAAKSYYGDGLAKEDYYSEGQEIAGQWGGRGAERLGLSGQVERAAFRALCDNLHPMTGERLTGRTAGGRTVGYDFNLHCPKSVSALHALTGDEAILSAFRVAVRETMQDIEADMQARVRKGHKDENRVTGNMVYAEFIHFTARPVGGVPDPHLHAHCFVFNATYDEPERQWKAGQFRELKRDAPYYEAAFHARLAGNLAALGYGIERSAKGWEIAGAPKSVIDKFSNRTAQIEAEAKAKGITNAKAKDQLGAKTRRGKQKGVGIDALRAEWAARLTPDEWKALNGAASGGASGAPPISDKAAVDYALAHGFERQSVMTEREVMAHALRHGVGAVTVEGVRREAARGDVLAREMGGRRHVTTKTVLAEEKAMIETVRRGRGQCLPLGKRSFVFDPGGRLNDEQKTAVNHVLRSRDAVTGISGGAGTGKTTLMREAVRGIEEGGKKVFTFAPTAEAARGVLRAEGFGNADTVAALLSSEQLQENIKGQVVWIDEAGLMGAKTMNQVLKLAAAQKARVILSGDVGQHRAVERGDAMRLLEERAGLKIARVREIQRQKGTYKEAVAAIAKGDLAGGFEKLERLNAVVELADDKRYKTLAGEYVEATRAGKTVLAVSPTHAEGAKVTEAIRAELRATETGKGTGAERLRGAQSDSPIYKSAERLRQPRGEAPKKKMMLNSVELQFNRLENLQLTEAQRGDARHYQPGLVVQFTQKAKGFENGARAGVVAVSAAGVEVVNDQGRNVMLPLDQAGRFQVYGESRIGLAVGEKIRITQNGFTVPDNGKGKGHRLNNGALYEVAGFTKAGDIKLNNGWTVRRDYGHLAYGYCATSHGSQGKTVDRVLIAQSAASLPASSREQFYVSVSRGREAVRIFTDDKQALREAVVDTSARMSATELVNGSGRMRLATLRQAERLRVMKSLARIHAARAVEAAKETARQIGNPQTWVERVRPQRQRDLELE